MCAMVSTACVTSIISVFHTRESTIQYGRLAKIKKKQVSDTIVVVCRKQIHPDLFVNNRPTCSYWRL